MNSEVSPLTSDLTVPTSPPPVSEEEARKAFQGTVKTTIQGLGKEVLSPAVTTIDPKKIGGKQLTEEKYQQTFDAVKGVANDAGILAASEKNQELIDVMQDVKNYVAEHHVFDGSHEELHVKLGEKHLFTILIPNDQTKRILLIFNENVIATPKPGVFKKLSIAFCIHPGNQVQKMIVTDQTAKDEIQQSFLLNEDRSAAALKGVEGTPQSEHFYYYVDDEGTVHQRQVIPFVEGGNLMNAIDDDTLTPIMKLNIAANTAKVLSEIHKKGLSHNDVKPANILLNEDGGVVLIDYGGACPVDKQSETSITCSPSYIPCEVFASPQKFQEEKDNVKRHYLIQNDLLPHLVNSMTTSENPIGPIIDKLMGQVAGDDNLIFDTSDDYNIIAKINPLDFYTILLNDKLFNSFEVIILDYGSKNSLDCNQLKNELESMRRDLKDPAQNLYNIKMQVNEYEKQNDPKDILKPKQIIPQKNDDYALGLILEELLIGPPGALNENQRKEALDAIGKHYAEAMIENLKQEAPGFFNEAQYEIQFEFYRNRAAQLIERVINGLQNDDPNQRMTSTEAARILAEIL